MVESSCGHVCDHATYAVNNVRELERALLEGAILAKWSEDMTESHLDYLYRAMKYFNDAHEIMQKIREDHRLARHGGPTDPLSEPLLGTAERQPVLGRIDTCWQESSEDEEEEDDEVGAGPQDPRWLSG